MVKLFSASSYPGIYVHVLKQGFIKAGDSIQLVEGKKDSLSLVEVFALLMKRNSDKKMFQRALKASFIADSA